MAGVRLEGVRKTFGKADPSPRPSGCTRSGPLVILPRGSDPVDGCPQRPGDPGKHSGSLMS